MSLGLMRETFSLWGKLESFSGSSSEPTLTSPLLKQGLSRLFEALGSAQSQSSGGTPLATDLLGRPEKNLNEAELVCSGLCKPFVPCALIRLILFLFMLGFCFVTFHRLVGCWFLPYFP